MLGREVALKNIIVYAMQFMVQILVVNSNITYRCKYRAIPQSYLFCESEREKVHDDRGNTLSVGKGKKNESIIGIYS